MNILIFSELKSLHSSIARKLIPSGMNLIQISNLEDIPSQVAQRADAAFIDDHKVEVKDLLQTVINTKKENPGSRIIIFTRSSDMNLVKVLVKAGVDLVLQSSLHVDTVADKFESFLQRLAHQHSQRKYIRIKMEGSEGASVQILVHDSNAYVNGSLTDISMGGVAAQFKETEMSLLGENVVFPGAKIKLGEKTVQADIQLVKKGGNLAAFCFKKMRDSFKDSLAEFIYAKTQALNAASISAEQENKPTEEIPTETEDSIEEEISN